MSGLRAPADELPFEEAVRRRVESFGDRSGLSIRLNCPGAEQGHEVGALPPRVTHELLRILSEALVNATRHSGGTRVAVSLENKDGVLELSVTDDGSGLPGPVDLEALKAAGHYGLAGMQERARTIGAELTVAVPPAGGTTVTVRLPLAPEASLEVASADGEASPVRMMRPSLIRRRSARGRA